MHASTRKILIIDDDPEHGRLLSLGLSQQGMEPHIASGGREGIERANDSFSLILLDLFMPDISGTEVLSVLKKRHPDVPIIIISCAELQRGVECVRQGAAWFLQKPFAFKELLKIISTLLSSKEESQIPGSSGRYGTGITGDSDHFKKLMEIAHSAADSESTILITGERGTGKSAYARYLHNISHRKDSPYITVCCDSIPHPYIEKEIFGNHATKGALGRAQGGTITLDNISSMPLHCQKKLLQFLKHRKVASEEDPQGTQIDIRIIAISSHDMEWLCNKHFFLEELYYRLMVLPIRIAPLRERRTDIPPLIMETIRRINRGSTKAQISLTDRCLDMLSSHNWQGNIRELIQTIEGAALRAEKDLIDVEDIAISHDLKHSCLAPESEHAQQMETLVLEGMTLEEIEKMAVLKTLQATEWNRSATARLLGISEKGLYNKIKRYELLKFHTRL